MTNWFDPSALCNMLANAMIKGTVVANVFSAWRFSSYVETIAATGTRNGLCSVRLWCRRPACLRSRDGCTTRSLIHFPFLLKMLLLVLVGVNL
jgi:hypothetical protein